MKLMIGAMIATIAIAGLAEPVQAGRVPRGYHCPLGQIWRPSRSYCERSAYAFRKPVVRYAAKARVITKTRVVVKYVTRVVNRTVVVHDKPGGSLATTAPEAMLSRLPYGGLPKLVHANMRSAAEFKLPPLQFQR